MSFGTLSKLFKGMLYQDQQRVVAPWGVLPNVAETWLHSLSYVRNVCAHHGRLWNRELAISPRIPHQPGWSGVVNSKRIYCVLCILQHMTSHSTCEGDWAADAVRLLHEMDGRPRWQNAMGCPPAWIQHGFWVRAAISTSGHPS